VTADYAREHGLAVKSFYYWRKRLLQLGVIKPEPQPTLLVFHKVQIELVPLDGNVHRQVSGCLALKLIQRNLASDGEVMFFSCTVLVLQQLWIN
jgi:hypothetical protein